MYRVLSGSQTGNVRIKIEEKLTHDDFELLIPYIDRLRQEVGPLKLLFDMTECQGQHSQTIWGDLVNQLLQLHEIPQVAVVGNHQQIESNPHCLQTLPQTTVKYFTSDQLDKAWNWVERGQA